MTRHQRKRDVSDDAPERVSNGSTFVGGGLDVALFDPPVAVVPDAGCFGQIHLREIALSSENLQASLHNRTILGTSEVCLQDFSEFPIYKIPKELQGYASDRMARRRAGHLEEVLRDAVGRFVRGKRGRSQQLADYLKRPSSWVTEYLDRQNHANLDTSLALMRFIGWRVDVELASFSPPPIDPDVLDALREPELVAALRALHSIGPGEVRRLQVELLQSLADAEHTAAQPPQSTAETRPARVRAAGAKPRPPLRRQVRP